MPSSIKTDAKTQNLTKRPFLSCVVAKLYSIFKGRTMSFPLSKSKLQTFHQCPKKLWLEKHHPELASPNEMSQLIMDRGTAFGNAVRSYCPGGILIAEKNPQKAIDETSALLKSFEAGAKRVPLYEAAFAYKGVIVRVDILDPLVDGSWELIEVKSGSLKPSYLRDAATQALVVRNSGAGVLISKISLGVPNKKYIRPNSANWTGILMPEDKTVEANELMAEIEASIEPAAATLKLTTAPDIAIGDRCTDPHDCGFITHCSNAKLSENENIIVPVWYLAQKPTAAIVKNFLPTIRDLADAEDKYLKKLIHRKMKEVAKGKPYYLDPALKAHLAAQPFPRYFLDYETNNTPLPLWTGTGPGEVVPFQFSIHVWTEKDAPLKHFEFIASTNADPRPALVAALVSAIDTPGPVYAWNGKKTEGPITKKLAELFPNDASALLKIAKSCSENDPLPHFNNWIYFPKMAGQWGLKAISKAVLPTNPYASLEIKNGVDAMKFYEKYLDMPQGPDRTRLEDHLKAYCGVDTSVMVDIWRTIEEMPASP